MGSTEFVNVFISKKTIDTVEMFSGSREKVHWKRMG